MELILNDLLDRCSCQPPGSHAASAWHSEPYHKRSEAGLGDQAGRRNEQTEVDAGFLAVIAECVRFEVAVQPHADAGEQHLAAVEQRDELGNLSQT